MKTRQYTGREGRRKQLKGVLCVFDSEPTEEFQVRLMGLTTAILCRAGCEHPESCGMETEALRRWTRNGDKAEGGENE